MDNAWLLAGLGNPGRQYEQTRHNAGFMLLDRLAERWRASWTEEKRFQARVARVERKGRRLMLCQPQTYMNLSGESVGALARYYQIPAERILVAVDDADLAVGWIRLRPSGSSGGHHGLDSVEQHLQTRQYARLRLGIAGSQDRPREIAGFVLDRFQPEEKAIMDRVLAMAADQVECWLDEGVQLAMNRFNGMINLN